MTDEEYFQERLDHQIKWYDTKSQKSQKLYKRFKGVEIGISATIPLFAGFISANKIWATVVGILGVIITAIEGWLAITKYHESWIEYRGICETLKHEKYMYLTKTGVYNSEDPFKLFVERVESIISKENLNWANLNNNEAEGR